MAARSKSYGLSELKVPILAIPRRTVAMGGAFSQQVCMARRRLATVQSSRGSRQKNDGVPSNFLIVIVPNPVLGSPIGERPMFFDNRNKPLQGEASVGRLIY